jgi:hypothetical protein
VNLCVTKDPSCLAFQNIIDVNGSSSAAAVGQVAPMLEQKCPVSEPSVPGVKVLYNGFCAADLVVPDQGVERLRVCVVRAR